MMNKIILSLSILFLSCELYAQSDRTPTPAERAAIDRVVHAVMPVVQAFANDNWELEDGGPDEPEDYVVQKHPDVVMGVAPFSDLKFSVKQGSTLWDTQVKPLLEKIENPANTPHNEKEAEAYDKLLAEFQNLSTITIEIHVNQKNINVNPVKGGKGDLKIPGCYFSYRTATDPNDSQTTNYVLAFGNWKNAKLKYYSNAPSYEFSFMHAKGSPFIENIVIIMKGNEKHIQETLKEVDWTKINKGLTL